MATLGKLWAGTIYGTNTGKFFLEMQSSDPAISGTLRLRDADLGIAVYEVEGTFDEKLKLTGKPVQGEEGMVLGELTAEAVLTPEGSLRGTWSTSIGSGGAFEAFPHDRSNTAHTLATGLAVPLQLYNKNITLGSIRLFADDVKHLLTYIRQDFTAGLPIVTFNLRGSQVTKFTDDFLRDAGTLGRLDYLKITIQEPEPTENGINRLIIVELNAFGINEIRGQSIHESWVIGKTEATAALLRRHQRTLLTTYKKFGLNLNQFVFLAMLVVIPDIDSWKDRTLFVGAIFVLLTIMLMLHARFIPNASIQLGVTNPSFLERMWPTFVSWIAAVAASLIAAWIYSLLT